MHLPGNLCSPDIQCPTKNEGETKYIVNLVWIIRTSGGNNGIGANSLDLLGQDFRYRVGQGHDDRFLGHGPDHFLLDHTGTGQAEEDIGTFYGICQGPGFRIIGKQFLVGCQSTAFSVNHTLSIHGNDVFLFHAHVDQQLETGDTGSTGTDTYQFHVFNLFVDQCQCIHYGRGHDDRGAVLVIMEDGNI